MMQQISMQVCYEAIMFDGADVLKLPFLPALGKSASEGRKGAVLSIIKNKLLEKHHHEYTHCNILEHQKEGKKAILYY